MTVCPYCVQWRCAECKSASDFPECCDYRSDAEPYWPDGSVATLTQDEPCERCAPALAEHMRASQ